MAHAENALDALGNPTRRQILQILSRGPRPVGAIAAELPVSRPAVSKHLRILRAAALVVHEPQGTQNVFRLRKEGFTDTVAWLGAFAEVASEVVEPPSQIETSVREPIAVDAELSSVGAGAMSGPAHGAQANGTQAHGAHPMPPPGVERHEG